jgi:hypothetical protein
MSISELTNSEIEIKLAGKAFKVKRLSIKDIFGSAEAKVTSQYKQDIEDIGKGLTGKDKLDYLITATKSIPKGSELHELGQEYLNSPMGMANLLYIGLSKCQNVTEEEVGNAILKSTEDERQMLMAYLSGSDVSMANTTDDTTDGSLDKKK